MAVTVDAIKQALRELGHQVEMTDDGFKRGKERMMAAVQRRNLIQAARDYVTARDGDASLYELQAKRAAFQHAYWVRYETSLWGRDVDEAVQRVLAEADDDTIPS